MYDLELEFRKLCLPQDICVMYYLELENYVYPKIFALCIIQNKITMFIPRLVDLYIEN